MGITDSESTKTRARILEIATVLFSDRGFFGVSMQDVADELGITKAALYYHFAGKESLFVAVIERVLSDLFEEIKKSAKSSHNPAEALFRVLETYLTFSLERPESSLLRQRGEFDQQVNKAVLNVNKKIKAFFEELFSNAAEQEQIQRKTLRDAFNSLTLFLGHSTELVKKREIKKTIDLMLKIFPPLINK